MRSCDKIKRLLLCFNKTWRVLQAYLTVMSERESECLSHIVIDFLFQGDLVRSLLLTGRSRAVCRFTLSIYMIFFVLCTVELGSGHYFRNMIACVTQAVFVHDVYVHSSHKDSLYVTQRVTLTSRTAKPNKWK